MACLPLCLCLLPGAVMALYICSVTGSPTLQSVTLAPSRVTRIPLLGRQLQQQQQDRELVAAIVGRTVTVAAPPSAVLKDPWKNYV
mmetsp:Transcript_13207/g.40026  ORF Transcript_13207/g.40026 Transcript_13207/m.40026 type:complete len:86 (+) Transcript_13207:4882-5139(+)